jgi:predicted N-acetyltransferase YhbS
MKIRKATAKDFEDIYRIGIGITELQVRQHTHFMERGELKIGITNRDHVFLVAEDEGKIVGFIYGSTKDMDSPLAHKWACLVYLAVIPKYRRRHVATMLYSDCIKRLKQRGVTHIYGWANSKGNAIQKFLQKHSFKPGNTFVWMDKKL